MEIIVDVSIQREDHPELGHYATVRRIYDTDLIPMVGMKLEDSAWKEPRLIQKVTINPVEGYYHLYVGDAPVQTEIGCRQEVEMYLGHGGKRL